MGWRFSGFMYSVAPSYSSGMSGVRTVMPSRRARASRMSLRVTMVSNPCQHILDVSFAVNNGDDLQRLRSAIHDHVLIYAEEQHAPTCKVATFVSFARKVAQA